MRKFHVSREAQDAWALCSQQRFATAQAAGKFEHAVHRLVIAVWIAAAAFAAIDPELELPARNIGASALRTALTVTLPLAMPGLMASAIFVFLESLDEFTGTYFVGVPDVTTLPLVMFTASLAGNYNIAAITALVLLVPSVGFMLLIERFLKAETLAKIG